jgi:hypothetical protein
MSTARYQVVLHALAPDATDTGSKYADTTLDVVSEEQLRKLLAAFANLTARLSPTVTPWPEIRIGFPAGMAMIAPIKGKLHYVSWDTKAGGIEVSVDDIMARVAAAAETLKPGHAEIKAGAPVRKAATGTRKVVTITLLGVAIVAMNVATVWMLLKPPRTILPPYVFLPEAESDALMRQVAGVYQTGTGAGDRHLEIEKLGLLRFAVYGKNRTLRRERLQTARGARIVDGVAIITNEYGLLRPKDPSTVTVYGDTYRRIEN